MAALASALFFAAVAVLVPPLLDGARRKLYAAVQRRLGPPLMQTWYDLAKLFSRRSTRPGTVPPTYAMGPVASLVLAVLAAAAIGGGLGPWPLAGVLLLEASAYALIAGSAGISPYTAAGSARLWAVAGLADAGVLVAVLSASRPPTVYAAAAAFAAAVMAAVAELELPPFNVAEAGPEIAAGPYTEYGGPLLATAAMASMTRGFTLMGLAALYGLGCSVAAAAAVAAAIYLAYAAVSSLIGRPRPLRAMGLAAAAFSLGVAAAALSL